MCAACAEDHPMGPDCVKKARERRMKEEKAKVSNLLFLLIKILFYTFLRRRREKRKHSARKKHQQLIFQKDLLNARRLNFDDQKEKHIEQPTMVHVIMTKTKCKELSKRRKSMIQNPAAEAGHREG